MQKQPIFFGLLILAQLASILFFMTDVITDAQSLGPF